MDSRLPKVIFLLLAVCAAVHFSNSYALLPAVMASHFDARGVANGWQTKQGFFTVLVATTVLCALIGFGVASIIGAVPIQLINLPNKQYWLAPENRERTLEFLRAHFAWFSCATYVVLVVAYDYAVQANLYRDHPPAVGRLWCTLAAFLAFVIAWLVRMLRRFHRPPQGSQG